MSDKPEATPWTIKSMPVEVRQKAVKAANAQDQTMAEWLVEAVNRLADQQANNLIMPPDSGKPTGKPDTHTLPEFDLNGFAHAVNASVAAMVAAGGQPPLSLGRDAVATVRYYARAARGLAPRQTKRQTNGQKRQTLQLIEGQT